MTNLDASYRVCACSMQRGNMQLLATPYVELDVVLGQSQAPQQRSCADLMSASVFVSLFFFAVAAAALFCVCVRLCHKFLFFLGSSLRKKRSDFTATTGGATCSSCSKSGRRFCRQQFANDERFKGGSSRQMEEGEGRGLWQVVRVERVC